MKKIVILFLSFKSWSLLACTPMPALTMFAGAVGLQTVLLPQKTAAILFPIVVFLKTLIFAIQLRHKFWKSFIAMLLGNVVSTIPGVLMGALMAAGPIVAVMSLTLMLPLGYYVGKNVKNHTSYNVSPYAIMLLTPVLAIISIIFFFIGTGAEFYLLGVPLNFGLKVISLMGAVAISLAISTLFEWIVCHRELKEFYTSQKTGRAAIGANIFVLFFIALVGAYLNLK